MLSKMFSLLLTAYAITSVLGTPYNITVSDQSPTIKYTPSRHGDPTQTWNVTYSDDGWSDFEPGAIRKGPSVHWTYFNGATATFGCKGTAIYVWGSAEEGEVSITVGGEDISNTRGGDYLAWKSGMKDQWWDVVVKVKGSTGVYLNYVTCTINLGNDGAQVSNRTIFALDGNGEVYRDYSFTDRSQWAARTTYGGVPGYDRFASKIAAARFTIPAITEETLVLAFGCVNIDHGRFSIDSSGPANGWPATESLDGNSPWFEYDQLIFFGVAKSGIMGFTNTDSGQALDISGFVFVTASGGTPNTGSNTPPDSSNNTANSDNNKPTDSDTGGGRPSIGIFVGGAIGGVVLIAIIAALIWLLCKRRKKAKTTQQAPLLIDDTQYDVEPYTETTIVSPRDGYFGNSEMAYANAAGPIRPTLDHSNSDQSTYNMTSLSPTRYQPLSPGISESSSYQSLPSPFSESSSQPNGDANPKVSQRSPILDQPMGQEIDAGPAGPVPPSYNPAWVQPGMAAAVTGDRGEGPSTPHSPIHSQVGSNKR